VSGLREHSRAGHDNEAIQLQSLPKYRSGFLFRSLKAWSGMSSLTREESSAQPA